MTWGPLTRSEHSIVLMTFQSPPRIGVGQSPDLRPEHMTSVAVRLCASEQQPQHLASCSQLCRELKFTIVLMLRFNMYVLLCDGCSNPFPNIPGLACGVAMHPMHRHFTAFKSVEHPPIPGNYWVMENSFAMGSSIWHF